MKRVGVTICKMCFVEIDIRLSMSGRRYLSDHDSSVVHFCLESEDDKRRDFTQGETALDNIRELLL